MYELPYFLKERAVQADGSSGSAGQGGNLDITFTAEPKEPSSAVPLSRLPQFNLKFKHISLLEIKNDGLSEFDNHLHNPVQAVMKPVRADEASRRRGSYAPLISFSFLNQRRSAAGLLPWVMQVRVMWSPSRAGFVRPLICGFSGTPEK